MRKKFSDPLEPKVYFPSDHHPGYRKAVVKYIGSGFKLPPGPYKIERAPCYLKKITQSQNVERLFPRRGIPITDEIGQAILEEASYFIPEEAERYAIKTVKEFGVNALRLPDAILADLRKERKKRPNKYADAMDRIASALADILRFWQYMIRYGTPKHNRRAKTHLKEFLKALIPETRGTRKRDLVTNPKDIKFDYYDNLFRLYHIRKTLSGPSRHRSEKVKDASKNFGLEINTIRKLWNLDDNDFPKARPVSLKEMARILTAQKCGITQHAVSNIISIKP